MEQLNIPRLNNEDFERGESFYRNVCDNIQLKDPLINIPDVLDVALNHTIMSLGNAFWNPSQVDLFKIGKKLCKYYE